MSNPTSALGTDFLLAGKRFESAVLKAFRLKTMFFDRRNLFGIIRDVRGQGDTVQFTISGEEPDAEYHTPGDRLLGQSHDYAKVSVQIDDFIVAHRFIRGDHDLISHFDMHTDEAQGIAQQLAEAWDLRFVCTGIKAARTAASSGFHSGGNVVSRVGGGTTIANAYPATTAGATNLRDDMAQLAQLLDEDNVPREGRYLAISPYALRVMTKEANVFSRDWQPEGRNKLLDRVLGVVEGFNIIVYNGLPNTNVSGIGPSHDTDKYDVDCRYAAGNVAAGTGQPVAVAFSAAMGSTAAVGVAMAENFRTFMEYDERENGLFMKAQQYFGMGVVAPWFAGEIRGQLS